ncbi:MAG TPA: phosphomannomutase, partial [Candidatus Altiarchaeales archaeon]|nr:phosphomannomutase [Candidatus Altiarchaeales archaeon]
MSIFRAYDIRGIAGKDLGNEIAEKIGKAFATYVGGGEIIVGYDARISSPELKEAVINGLVSAGCDVVDIGMVPTPLVYFSVSHFKKDGGIMITGSHNPPEYNGFKLLRGDKTLYGEEIQDLRRIIESGRFSEGSGNVKEKNVIRGYQNYILKRVKLGKKLKIVIDCGNGAAGPVAVNLFENFGCKVIPLYCEPDGNFPNHHPDPTVDETLD